MKVALLVAWRYFYTLRRQVLIHRLSLLSMGMVTVSTYALVIGLSAFNGIEGLLRRQYNAFDAPFLLRAKEKYSFQLTDNLQHIFQRPDIEAYSPILEDYALVTYEGRQLFVKFRGLLEKFLYHTSLRNYLLSGQLSLTLDQMPAALMSYSTYRALYLHPQAETLQLLYPTSALSFRPNALYRTAPVRVAGTFALQHTFEDNYLLLPLHFAQSLVSDSLRSTGIAFYLSPNASAEEILEEMRKSIGPDFELVSREKLHQSVYHVLRIEKLFVFLILGFVLIVASFSLVLVLSMLFMEKKKDLSLLVALGANRNMLGSIFLWKGLMISSVGGVIGIGLAGITYYAQTHYGIISLGLGHTQMFYPMHLKGSDILLVWLSLVGLTLIASLRPALMAARSRATSSTLGET